jgi:hypothetical protein
MWLPYRLTQLLPTRARLRKGWYRSVLFHGQCELKRRFAIAMADNGSSSHQTGSPTVTLVRVIGNDLYPRHRHGQALKNLKTILQDEATPPGWTKLFILNRLIDPQATQQAVAAIREAGHHVEVIPFDPATYQTLRYQPQLFGGLDYFSSAQFEGEDVFVQDRIRIWACGEKIRYLMNINGARNVALASGLTSTDWTFVLDGSCIVPDAAFAAFDRDLSRDSSARYLIIPMRRLSLGMDLGEADCSPSFKEEPQIGFRFDAIEQFDPVYPYGVRDKTSLLHRLGVPGPWCAWAPLPWYPGPRHRSSDRYRFTYASASVLRLTSGVDNGGLEKPSAQIKRYRSRITAIFSTLMAMDRQCSAPDSSVLPAIAGFSLEADLSTTGADH